MTESLAGKRITQGNLGNSPHKFVWYNLKPPEFAAMVKGKAVGKAHTRGRWLFVPVGVGREDIAAQVGVDAAPEVSPVAALRRRQCPFRHHPDVGRDGALREREGT